VHRAEDEVAFGEYVHRDQADKAMGTDKPSKAKAK
jgi:hypothetical protein